MRIVFHANLLITRAVKESLQTKLVEEEELLRISVGHKLLTEPVKGLTWVLVELSALKTRQNAGFD